MSIVAKPSIKRTHCSAPQVCQVQMKIALFKKEVKLLEMGQRQRKLSRVILLRDLRPQLKTNLFSLFAVPS